MSNYINNNLKLPILKLLFILNRNIPENIDRKGTRKIAEELWCSLSPQHYEQIQNFTAKLKNMNDEDTDELIKEIENVIDMFKEN